MSPDTKQIRPDKPGGRSSQATTTSSLQAAGVKHPYASAARDYYAAGWESPFPLPPRRKKYPPAGVTGRGAPMMSRADVEAFCEDHPDGNIGLRFPPGVIGIDADLYKSETAPAAWQQLIAECGPLPAGPCSTSRGDGSGIRLFRVPEAYEAVGTLPGDCGEVVQNHHRYAVVWPSIHPDTGQPYRWIGKPDGWIPRLEDLPELPQAWLDKLRAGNAAPESPLFKQPAGYAHKSGWTSPDIDDLAVNGTKPGTQHDQMRDLVAQLVGKGMTRAAVEAVWWTAVGKTTLHDPDRWTQHYFDDMYDKALRKYGSSQQPAEPADEERPDLPDFDLGELAAAGVKPPERIGGGMLYRGGMHCLAGQPGGGKTTIIAHWMLHHIREGGRVLLLDEESGPEMIAEKFLDLGATPAELRPPNFSYIPFPSRSWTPADIAQLHARMSERQPGIVAWDSAAAFLAIGGYDENAAADVTRFWQKVLIPCARIFGAAVIGADHTGKNPEHMGYGRGSGAKKAASDVQYIVETITPFNRTTDGLLKVTTSPGKDRRGWLSLGYEVIVRAGPPLTLEVSETAGGTDRKDRGGPPAKLKLLAALNSIATPENPKTGDQLTDEVKRVHGHGLTRQTWSKYLNELMADGLADCIDPGSGRVKLWYPTTCKPVADTSPTTYVSASPPSIRGDDDDTPDTSTQATPFAWPAGSIGDEVNS